MRTLRILAVSHLYPHVAERRYGIFVARQLRAMAEEGAEITLLVPRPFAPGWMRRLRGMSEGHNHQLELVEYAGVHAIPIPYLNLPGIWFWRWAGLSVYRAIRATAKQLHLEYKFDVIYSTQIILGGDAGRRLAQDLRIPSANLAIGTDVNVIAKQSNSMQSHFRTILSELDGTLTCGQSLADEIRSHRPHPANPETLCVHGVVDLEQFIPVPEKSAIRKSLQLPTDKCVILYVGYLRREKGLFELIEAFESIHKDDPNTELVICGSGVDEASITAAVKHTTASEAIRLIGNIDPHEVCRYMQSSDLFVLPSHGEGMPNAVMEAMACGLPVICTTVGGLTAALRDSAGAILVPPQDASQLASAMKEVVTNSVRRSKMASAARSTAEERFGARRNARKILAYLADVISSARSSTKTK